MKIRNGFVSNSSSSSFIILLDSITDQQKQMIYNHIEISKEIDDRLKLIGKEPIYKYYEEWNISEDDFSIWLNTSLDNFDMEYFITQEVKIPYEKIILIGDEWYFYNLYEDPIYKNMKRFKKVNKIFNNIKK